METIYKPINPRSKDAKSMRTKNLPINHYKLVEGFPNFHKSGSIKGMKKMYYGKGALLVKCGQFIFNVSSKPEIYFKYAN